MNKHEAEERERHVASLREEIEALDTAQVHTYGSDAYVDQLYIPRDEALAIIDRHELTIDFDRLRQDIEDICKYHYGHAERSDFICALISAMKNNVTPKPETPENRPARKRALHMLAAYHELMTAADALPTEKLLASATAATVSGALAITEAIDMLRKTLHGKN